MSEVWFAFHPNTGCWWTTNQLEASRLNNEPDWFVELGQAMLNRDAWQCMWRGKSYTVSGFQVANCNPDGDPWRPYEEELEEVAEERDGVTLEELFAEDEG